MVFSSSSVTPELSSRRSSRQSAVRPESAADAAAVNALCRVDEDTFTRLMDQHQAAMLRIARLFVSSPAWLRDPEPPPGAKLLTNEARLQIRARSTDSVRASES